MMDLCPRVTKDCAIETTHLLTGKYRSHCITGATVKCRRWQENIIISQTFRIGDYWMQLCVTELEQPAQIQVTATTSLVFLSCMLEGNCLDAMIEGSGPATFEAQHMRLCHFPAKTTHYSKLDKGRYVFLNIGMSPLLTQEDPTLSPGMKFLLSKCRKEDTGALLQQSILMSPEAVAALTALWPCENALPDLPGQSVVLLQEYTKALNELSRIPAANLRIAIDVWKYINENLKENLLIERLSQKFGTNPCTLNTAFQRITCQTINRYTHEKKMLTGRQLLKTNPRIKVSKVANAVNMSNDHFSRSFSARFAITPSEYVEQVQDGFIQDELDDID
jgi:AraC-like DNA-binding protein